MAASNWEAAQDAADPPDASDWCSALCPEDTTEPCNGTTCPRLAYRPAPPVSVPEEGEEP